MHGQDERTSDMFSYVSPEARVRRIIRCARFGP
jgi:hypothetical protein